MKWGADRRGTFAQSFGEQYARYRARAPYNLTLPLVWIIVLLLSGCVSPTTAPSPPQPQQPTKTSRQLILATFAPRQVLGVDADGVTQFGDFDFSQLPALIEAGINEISAPIEFMAKDMRRQYELRCAFVTAVKPYGIRYYHSIPTYKNNELMTACPQPPEDENFTSGAIWLDEPYAYFPDETFTGASDVRTASEFYVRYVARLLTEERRSPMSGGQERNTPLPTANTFESLAWYDLEAGSDGFWVEGLGGFFLQQIHFFNASFDTGIPETPENYVRLIAAFERGASDHFGKTWGYGVYLGTPPHLREMILEELYERGATYFFFWANHADGTLTTEEVIALAKHLNHYARTHTPSKTRAALAIVIPAGYHIPGGIYCSAELPDREGCIAGKGAEYSGGDLWNVLPAVITEKTQGRVNPQDVEILRALGKALKEALAGEEEFDILVNDESLKPGYVDRYERVIWIGK